MNVKKRALHLAVVAGMVGTGVLAAAPAAHAATALPDFCGVYLQGTPSPSGGLIANNLIPFPGYSLGTGSHSYAVYGHESKGQDKTVSDLNNTAAGAKRFALGVTIGGTITGNTTATGPVAPALGNVAGGVTSVKIGWKNDTNTGNVTWPTVQVGEAAGTTKANIAKGVVNGAPAADRLGPQVGNVQHGNAVAPQNEVVHLTTPAGATSGTFSLALAFPNIPSAGPLAGVTITVPSIAYNIGAAALQAQMQAVYTAYVGPGTPSVTGTDWNGTNGVNGDYNISFGGAFATQSLPSLSIPAASVTGSLATTVLDDGSLWNALRNGGDDAALNPIIDLGQGIYTSSGTMNSGGIPLVGAKTTGKASFVGDTQYLFLQYPAGLVTALAPNLATDFTAAGLLQSIVGANLTVNTDTCGVLGVLALFCTAASGSIPATLAPICGLI